MPKGKNNARQYGGQRKPSPDWIQWAKELESIEDLIYRLKESKSMGGDKWRASMLTHYTKRLTELRKSKPRKFPKV